MFVLEKGDCNMQHLNSDYFQIIENFINDYADSNGGTSPSLQEIAGAVGIAKSTASKYLNYMKENNMLQFSGVRNITTKQMERDSASSVRHPVLGRISCGIPKFAEENIEEYVKLPTSLFGKGPYFILQASGESMINVGIEDGDYVVIKQQNTADYNQIVVALVDDEATLKRFRPQEDCIILHPENPNFDDIIVQDCIIQGVAVKVLKDLR